MLSVVLFYRTKVDFDCFSSNHPCKLVEITDGIFFTVHGSPKQDYLVAMRIGAGRLLRLRFEQVIQRDHKLRPCQPSE